MSDASSMTMEEIGDWLFEALVDGEAMLANGWTGRVLDSVTVVWTNPERGEVKVSFMAGLPERVRRLAAVDHTEHHGGAAGSPALHAGRWPLGRDRVKCVSNVAFDADRGRAEYPSDRTKRPHRLPLLRAVPEDELREALQLMAAVVKHEAVPPDIHGVDPLMAWIELTITAQRIFVMLWNEVERREKRDDETLERDAKAVLARFGEALEHQRATLDDLKQRHAACELSNDEYGDALIALAA